MKRKLNRLKCTTSQNQNKMVGIETKFKKIYASGKRKTAVAKAIIETGTGNITFNGKDYKTLHMFDRLKLEEPVRITEQVIGSIDFNATITVHGGGDKGQIDAARLALAKGIIEFMNNDELRLTFLSYDRNLLVADARRKEACKPGDSKARAMRQSSKR